ncbi:hypothetical protein JG688_00001555 [Phytophthora aleatoria]|uniref:SCP domain-containing protein n=1 Tax=Phytophthora aleatoria TaxID=2496075 RepID=A0A8J5M9F5_9STRA|nr:hypothetical protein JG688_00001555 [Phytophthora aleatoria]
MSLLQLLRATLLFVGVITTLCGLSAYADPIGGNSTANNTTRFLEQAATDYRVAMLNAVNKERAARGLPKFCMNKKLQAAAQAHAADMARRSFLSHTGSDGSTMSTRVRAAGYRWATVAENVAAGQATVNSVLASWMNSKPHRANILSTMHKMFGCGYAVTSSSKYKHYWTQDFASGNGEVVEEFSSLLNSTKTCVNMLFNNFDVKIIDQIDYSVAYYWSYMSLMTFVLLNIVLAIVVDAYKKEKDKKDKSKCWVFRRVLDHVIRHWLAPVRHVLAFFLCCAPSRRYSVVFWGRIRARVLQEALTDRLGAMPLDWSPQTKLTPSLLKTLFPDATFKECEATIQHLMTRHINRDCCPSSEETERPERPSLRKTSIASSAPKSPDEKCGCCVDTNTENPDFNQVSARLDLLEQKLDYLIEKLTHKAL